MNKQSLVIGIIFFFLLLSAIGFMSPSASDTSSKKLPLFLNASQTALMEPHIAEDCAGRKYCIVAFFASWCSVSGRTQHIVPALRAYFKDDPDVGVVDFLRHSSWGQPGAEQDTWQRDIQRNLGLGFSVPAFAILEDGYRVTGQYSGGIRSGGASQDKVAEFFLDTIQADHLKH